MVKRDIKPTYTPENYYRCSGEHPLPDGQRVAWSCETKDGDTFTRITIDSKSYDLTNGRLFVLSSESGTVKLLQLDRDMTKLSVGGLDNLAEEDSAIGSFLGMSNDEPVD